MNSGKCPRCGQGIIPLRYEKCKVCDFNIKTYIKEGSQ